MTSLSQLKLELGALYGTPVFILRMHGVGVPEQAAAKQIYGGSYDGMQRLWRFPAFYPFHRIVLKTLRQFLPQTQLTSEVRQFVQQQERPPSLPPNFTFHTQPFSHQLEGLLHLNRCLRAGLFYSPGLGKCKITVDLQRLTGDKLLILCPRIMLDTWQREFERHGQVQDVLLIEGSKEEKLARIAQATARAPVATVVSYATAALYAEELLQIPYQAIVADESHQMKSHDSKRTVAAQHLAQRAYRRVLLSGTPSLGSPYDLYPQLKFLAKYLTPETYWAFRKKFGVFYAWEEDDAVPRTVLGYKNFEALNRRVQLVGLRKTKEECLDLPMQQIIDLPFSLENDQKKCFNELVDARSLLAGAKVRQELVEGKLNVASGTLLDPYVLADEQIALLNKIDQAASGFVHTTRKNPGLCNDCAHVTPCSFERIRPYTKRCKVIQQEPPPVTLRVKSNARLDACREVLENILADPNNKVIIWANYMAELNDLEKLVQEMDVLYVRVDGGSRSHGTHFLSTENPLASENQEHDDCDDGDGSDDPGLAQASDALSDLESDGGASVRRKEASRGAGSQNEAEEAEEAERAADGSCTDHCAECAECAGPTGGGDSWSPCSKHGRESARGAGAAGAAGSAGSAGDAAQLDRDRAGSALRVAGSGGGGGEDGVCRIQEDARVSGAAKAARGHRAEGSRGGDDGLGGRAEPGGEGVRGGGDRSGRDSAGRHDGIPKYRTTDEKVVAFNSDQRVRVYLGQVATGIGITLNASNYTLYYSLSWSLEHYLQSLDRNYRIGQTKPVTVYRLLGKHTLDESKAKALDQKIDFASLVTSASVCATCDDYYSRCHTRNIRLYDLECKFDREMLRETATIRRIP